MRLRSGDGSEQRFKRTGFMGLSGRRVDLLEQYEKHLEDVEDNVRTEQSSVAMKVNDLSLILLGSGFCWAVICFWKHFSLYLILDTQ